MPASAAVHQSTSRPGTSPVPIDRHRWNRIALILFIIAVIGGMIATNGLTLSDIFPGLSRLF